RHRPRSAASSHRRHPHQPQWPGAVREGARDRAAVSMIPLLAPQRGHFRFESGHHSSLWIDLETLFLEPARVEPLADELALRLARHEVEVVCGPLVEGAF